MKSLRNRRARKQEVDLSPLIDVVFILLIFFMVTTTFVKDSQLDIERPGSQSGTPANSQALRIYLDRAGNLAIDQTPVKSWMLQSRVREFLRSGNSETVLVVADRRVQADLLIDVVDQCRLAGATGVAVVTDSEAG